MSETQRPLRVLVAGAGVFGREHLTRLLDRPDIELAGVADPNSAACAWVRSRRDGARCFADAAAMIDEVAAEAIVVATPPATHVDIARNALARGLCVLLEKPLADSAAHLAPLLEAARNSREFVLPGHVLRHARDHQRLVEVVRSGEIGGVIYVNSRRYRDEQHAVLIPDVDPVLVTLVHDIDLAQWITGDRFRSVLARRSGGPGQRNLTAINVATTGGGVCDLRTAWTFPVGDAPGDCVEVVGARGAVELLVGRSLTVHAGGRRRDIPLERGDDSLRNEIDEFIACVRDRSRPRALGLDEALAGLRLADAALESLRTGREATVAP